VDPVEAALADQASFVVLHPVLMKEPKGWSKAAAINELHHGEQFFQLVFQGRSVNTEA
jgi:hypothetical protein